MGKAESIFGITGGNLFQFACLVFLGKFVGENWRVVYNSVNKIGGIAGIVIIVFVVGYIIMKKYTRKNKN
jgi:membrane protein DedA with SNARE-associated domain